MTTRHLRSKPKRNRIARARKRIAVRAVSVATPVNSAAITSARAALVASVIEQMIERGELTRSGSKVVVKHDE